MNTLPESFTIPEPSVSLRLGVSLAEVKKNRGSQGVGWNRVANGRVMWNEPGVVAFERRLALGASNDVAAEKIPAPVIERLTVIRARTPRVLHVVRQGKAHDPRDPLSLWLPRPVAHLFWPGMAIAGRLREGNPRLFDFEGNPDNHNGRKLPRRPGHW